MLTESWNKADSASMNGDLTWNIINGGYDIVSNQARSTAANSRNIAVVDTALPSSSMYAEVDHAAQSTSANGAGVVLASSRTAQTQYYIEAHDTANTVNIVRTVSGSNSTVASTAWAGSPPVLVRGEFDGSTVKAFLDGVEVLSYTDGSPLTGLYAGIRSFPPAGATVTFDNFEAGPL